ncbi:hypothetical protein DRW07_00245 [Alteromonas sediminis]|uniref:YdbS-like PH domain-containing protein n=1 Tax=Alteromonas sediminis TaxID=2259342 RepID=A0A3N5ZD56_9ALTE|nr:PH domain-containing protein [Alteromonas sediminis]RPJ67878.1 hypothetical protein DRW07_00245 [Alteromonas sediminis]
MKAVKEQRELAQALSFEMDKWHRLSLFAVMYYFFQNVLNIGRSAFYLIPVLALNLDKVKAHLAILLPAVLALLCLVLCWSIAYYLKFTFKLTHQKLIIKSGVFKRNTLDLPFERIQSVKIVQPFFFRFTGHAAATLDSAGSAQNEAVLAALVLHDAEAIKEHVMKVAKKPHGDEESINRQHDDVQILNKRQLKDLIIHGISNNRVWLILGGLAPFFDNFFEAVEAWLTAQGLTLSQLVGDQTIAWWQFGLYAITLIAIAGFLVALLSVFGAIMAFHNYVLLKQGERYVRKSGLLSVQEVSMQHSRLQVIKLKQDWLDVILKRINFFYLQNQTGFVAGESLAQTNQVLVPSVTYQEAHALLSEAMPDSQADTIAFQRVSGYYLINRWFVRLLPLFILTTSLSLFADTYSPLLINLAAFSGFVGLIYLRWLRWGVAWDEKYIYVQNGLIGKTVRCFERYKMQQVSLKQSFFMRRNKVMNVQIVLASGGISVPFVPENMAKQLAQETLDIAQTTQKSWM